ncbi:NAD-dependent protein deacetylase [Pseudoxanthomonas sp. z9]|uniref:NAD-dependent protein deacetylase n=1 Tax=Pseudoxanthomonas sp. z9 TaxID=2584942 RepID=UPI00114294C6|nr:NAD-dependent protein deacetylase [Pseudoxanthomonas sp. z9]
MSIALTAPHTDAADRLREWLLPFDRVFVLTGAGCSTASGIPDYRDADGQWKRTPPVTYQAFTADPLINARYWARSFVGWPRMAQSRPNAAHRTLAAWQGGRLSQLLTQNVDGLHERAGSRDVIDLHGRIDQVVCLQCRALSARAMLQERLHAANPGWHGLEAATAPDGDADLEGLDFSRFRVPDCDVCGGMLKPDVVFFGENVPRERYERALAALDASQALLVVGSSLMVYSGFRFARIAHEAGKPIALLNRGQTRADALADLKLDADCVAVLPAV